jgi:adenylyltransferase/sulfurtransferase
MAIEVKEITATQLKELTDGSYDFQLIDVREPSEYEIANLKGKLIPMNSIPENIDKIDRDRPVVVYCRTGVRSVDAIVYLQKEHQFDNLYNLKGGIHAWADEVDPSVTKY